MRFSAIVSIVLCAGAFVLGILALLAGTRKNFITDVYIVRVNTTNVGHVNLPDSDNSILDKIENIGEDILNQVTSQTSEALGLHDFYYGYVMTYCDADLKKTPSTTDPDRNTYINFTYCAPASGWFDFDLIDILNHELGNGTFKINDDTWPKEVQTVIHGLSAASRAMFVMYVIGLGLCGLTFLLSFVGCLGTRIIAAVVAIIAFLSFLFLGVASALATVIGVKIRDVFNEYLDVIRITANTSPKFLGLTWAATATMLLVTIYWMAACCKPSERRRRRSSIADETVIVEKAPPVRRERFWHRYTRRY